MAAASLPHPEAPAFEACATDMDVAAAVVAERIARMGWAETDLSEELQEMGHVYGALRYFGASAYLGKTSVEDWTASLQDYRNETGGLPAFGLEGLDQTYRTRAFRDPAGSGVLVLTSDDDNTWSCEILLNEAPPNASDFMSTADETDEVATAEGFAFRSVDQHPGTFAEMLALLPFVPMPKVYYAEYLSADPEILRERYGLKTSITFAAQVSVINAF
ncbi:hypothetical protein AADZ90_006830 [Aestuariibius sp. 2305UL40-4]|uniref:hypothetical protein n=1 Tax=Aestuariibius violaceus TaxID=3234132 RepID=UPI00345EE198